MGDMRVDFGAMPAPLPIQRDEDEDMAASSYLASRNTQRADPNSAAQREVTSMNREMDQWSQAAAPNVFAEEKSR